MQWLPSHFLGVPVVTGGYATTAVRRLAALRSPCESGVALCVGERQRGAPGGLVLVGFDTGA